MPSQQLLDQANAVGIEHDWQGGFFLLPSWQGVLAAPDLSRCWHVRGALEACAAVMWLKYMPLS